MEDQTWKARIATLRDWDLVTQMRISLAVLGGEIKSRIAEPDRERRNG